MHHAHVDRGTSTRSAAGFFIVVGRHHRFSSCQRAIVRTPSVTSISSWQPRTLKARSFARIPLSGALNCWSIAERLVSSGCRCSRLSQKMSLVRPMSPLRLTSSNLANRWCCMSGVGFGGTDRGGSMSMAFETILQPRFKTASPTNGFERRSSPNVPMGPCPGMNCVSSPRGQSLVVID